MSRKSKRKQKQIFREYLDKVNDNGVRHYHCPTCVVNNKELVKGTYTTTGEFMCDRCNTKWVMIA